MKELIVALQAVAIAHYAPIANVLQMSASQKVRAMERAGYSHADILILVLVGPVS